MCSGLRMCPVSPCGSGWWFPMIKCLIIITSEGTAFTYFGPTSAALTTLQHWRLFALLFPGACEHPEARSSPRRHCGSWHSPHRTVGPWGWMNEFSLLSSQGGRELCLNYCFHWVPPDGPPSDLHSCGWPAKLRTLLYEGLGPP